MEEKDLELKNAVIESTMLGYEDHGIMTCMLYLNYGGSGQGFGGYTLDEPVKDAKGNFKGRVGSEYGMQFIIEILNTVGVDSWEKLKGKHIRVKAEHTKVHAIGHILEDKWFSPKELWERYEQKNKKA